MAYARSLNATARREGLTVRMADERGRALSATGVGVWLARVAPPRVRGVVHIAVVSDQKVRSLNRRYRRKNKATDVLSFPVDRRGVAPVDDEWVRPFLGDIVIARGVAEQQARALGHSVTTELRVLALHGLLHLLGYDHENDDGRMRRVEARLRRKGGLSKGLIERSRDSA